MHLKSLEIVGFKSFADKTRLEFKPGITGVIGPNGCGKTNVMEAIRWCLGEMSWKSLRSPSMVDVIFNGNARRKPLSMAEVTLTFDNTSGQLPVQYTEITVTRRIFRSGESEYLLNKTACRLKDIRELFLDTGIGGDGYAIIDQGGVDFVLRSKPEDRRSLFEEAAGVAKYRAKREEALRKLERVEADLARLQDSIALITEQIKKLDSDARKAKLYQKYKDELTAQEVGQLLQDLAALGAEIDREAALIDPVRRNLESKKNELDAEQGRLAAARLENTQQQAQAAELHQRIAGVKAEIGRLQERIHNAKRTVEALQARKEKDLLEMESARQRLAQLDPEMEKAREVLSQAALAVDSAKTERDEFAARLATLHESIGSAEAEASGLRARFNEAAQATQDAARKLSSMDSDLRDQISSVRETLKDLSKTLTESQAAGIEAQSEASEVSAAEGRLQERKAAHAAAEAQRSAKAAEIAAVSDQIVGARTECAVLKARVETLEAQGAQDPYWVGAQAVLAANMPGVLGTLRSLLTVEPGFEQFVLDALGERLTALVCEDLTSARNAIELLESAGKGRARFLVLSALPDPAPQPSTFPPQARPLLHKVKWDPRIEAAAHLLLAECYCLGNSLFGSHWISGGIEPKETVSVQLSDVSALKRQTGEFEATQASLSERKAVLEGELAAAEGRVREAAAAVQEETVAWGSVEARRRERQGRIERLGQYAEVLTQDSARILGEIAAAKEALILGRQAVEEKRKTESEFSAAENEALRRVTAMQGELEARRSQGDVLEKAFRQAESQHAVIENQCGRLAMEEESLKASLDRRRADIEDIEKQIAEYQAVDAESKTALEDSHQRLAQGEVEAQGFSAKLSAAQISIDTMQQNAETLGAETQRLQDELHQWELKASELKVRRDSQKGRLWDEWQFTVEEASAKYQQVAVDPEKIQTLRRRIQNMGNINLAAPEEYEALTGKHTFFMSQVEDLAKAKEDLRQAISKINATTREHFRQTFTEVREHFVRIYGTLFEGGEADLVLTDQENLLETGIDIVAQPPGKRLQSITLLSGGERTLTAIALLFAFFMVRPSPMCMLDEADAALDEANVGRFAAMVREFASKSQFLVISHNKKTMTCADQMYGVTMEESGVSQLLAVDFQDKKDSPAPKAGEAEKPAGTEAA
ncbi:MAG: chromosome segregation protein SMC [Elusimicrobia bacterium]|nr:chromosome segregation protein SMC [Elusimicrobiota bacterium]